MVQNKERDAAFLQQALKITTEYESVQQAFNEQQDVVKQATRNLQAAQKDVQNETETEIKRQKNEISDEFNARLDERTAQIKKVKAQRGKMRAEGIKSRIQMETQSLLDANQAINQNTKELFRQNKIPGFANSASFFTLFVTSSVKEYLIAILTVLLLLVVLPLLIYIMLDKPGVLWMVVIYVIDVAFFGGIYMLITNTVKIKHAPIINQGRQNWNMILENRRKIRRITKGIKKDQDDSLYGLQEFDAQLMQLEQEKRSINEERLQALAQFDSEGRARISTEVQERNNSRLAELQDELEAANKRFEELISQTRELQLTLSKDYEPRIGKEFMTSDKLDRLLSVFRSSTEINLSEAQEVVRSGKLPEHTAHAAAAGNDEEHIPDPSEIMGGTQDKASATKKTSGGQHFEDAGYASAAGVGFDAQAMAGMDQPIYASGVSDSQQVADNGQVADNERIADKEQAADQAIAGENPFGQTVSDTVDVGE